VNIPRFWVRADGEALGRDGRRIELMAWGWSTVGKAEAQLKARERLDSLSRRVEQGLELPRGYGYGERPMREEIIRELGGEQGVAAIISRNSYGSLVLNARDAMFVDVDFPEPKKVGLVTRLFGRSAAGGEETARLDRLRTSLESLPGTFRIYRTKAGWRVLATDRRYDPRSDESLRMMKRMDADPAFLKLCRVQKSFRARLTPKPWRCDLPVPPGRYPREDPKTSARFARWLQTYERTCSSRATCRWVESVGGDRIADQLRPIIELHDSLTGASTDRPLA